MMLNEFCAQFGIREADLGAVHRQGNSYYLASEAAINAAKGQEVFSLGVYLGTERKEFTPSAALVELIASKAKEHRVVVDEKAAWLFLCGRDVLPKGVVHQDKPTEQGLVLVENELGENLGYGKQVRDMVKNVLDRGHFLRRER